MGKGGHRSIYQCGEFIWFGQVLRSNLRFAVLSRHEPLAMDEIIELLQISKGSASQGLRALRQLGIVSTVFASGDRKERFVAEIRLRKLVSGFLREQADPHLENGMARLKQIADLLGNTSSENSQIRGFRRYEILSGWHRQMSRLLPLG